MCQTCFSLLHPKSDDCLAACGWKVCRRTRPSQRPHPIPLSSLSASALRISYSLRPCSRMKAIRPSTEMRVRDVCLVSAPIVAELERVSVSVRWRPSELASRWTMSSLSSLNPLDSSLHNRRSRIRPFAPSRILGMSPPGKVEQSAPSHRPIQSPSMQSDEVKCRKLVADSCTPNQRCPSAAGSCSRGTAARRCSERVGRPESRLVSQLQCNALR